METRFSLASTKLTSTILNLTTVCLNSALHDLDGKALRVAKVGFTFFLFLFLPANPSGGVYTNYVLILKQISRLYLVCATVSSGFYLQIP